MWRDELGTAIFQQKRFAIYLKGGKRKRERLADGPPSFLLLLLLLLNCIFDEQIDTAPAMAAWDRLKGIIYFLENRICEKGIPVV